MESANGPILRELPLAKGSGNSAEARLMPRFTVYGCGILGGP